MGLRSGVPSPRVCAWGTEGSLYSALSEASFELVKPLLPTLPECGQPVARGLWPSASRRVRGGAAGNGKAVPFLLSERWSWKLGDVRGSAMTAVYF